MLHHCISLMVEDGAVIQYGLGHAGGKILGVFYAHDGLLGFQDTECLQSTLNVLIGMFRMIGLAFNVYNPNTTTCHMRAT